MRKQQSPVPRPGPASDLDDEVKAILDEDRAEPWVVLERAAIEKAGLARRALWWRLGLAPLQRFSYDELRRLAAWDRMLDGSSRFESLFWGYYEEQSRMGGRDAA
jgi:hypothetical protein